VAPEHAAVRRIEAGDLVAGEQHELQLSVDVDEKRRGRRLVEIARLPRQRAGLLVERGHGLAAAADRHDDGAVVERRAAGVPAARRRRAVLLHEIV